MSRSLSQDKSDLLVTRTLAAEIGPRIRKIRGIASQREFAGRLGISREQLSRIESGLQVPGTATLRRLAQVARVSLDLVVLGATPTARAAAAQGAGAWEALEPLVAGTRLRLTRGSGAPARKADRAWQHLPEERKENVRELVRRIAVVAVAIEALLPGRASNVIADELSSELAALVVERILDAG